MANISVPITDKALLGYVEHAVKSGLYASKADMIRIAIEKMREDEILQSLSASRLDAKAGRVYKGNLKDVVEPLCA